MVLVVGLNAPSLPVEGHWVHTLFEHDLPVAQHVEPQTGRPSAQPTRQLPAAHTCPVGQAVPHAPQLAASLCVSAQVVPHAVSPVAHSRTHTPARHACIDPHERAQAPQLRASVCVLTSQPFDTAPSQSAKPEAHSATEQRPAEQVPVEFAGAQRAPHAPQCVVLVSSAASQPLVRSPSQLAKFVSHENEQKPVEHATRALGPVGHTAPQRPQLPVSVARFVSQPLAALPSQSAKPTAQVTPQAPALHVEVALALAGQVFPHAPQLRTSAESVTSQPFEAMRSQSA